MFNYNNTHIFTGYLKQLLSAVNIPTCKIYTKEFADYLNRTGQEDPRVVESISATAFRSGLVKYPGAQINYLKDNKIMSYNWQNLDTAGKEAIHWSRASEALFMGNNRVDGLTRTFSSPGKTYDNKTHNYLGDFLRFLRDYHNVNLMSLYNCFDNKIYNNVYLSLPSEKQFVNSSLQQEILPEIIVSSSDPTYKIYAVPVKLFENYTIAIDCSESLELFCGFYSTRLDTTDKGRDLIRKTYKKVSKTFFHKPFLYTELNVQNWNREIDHAQAIGKHGEYLNMPLFAQKEKVNRWDILNREQDLKLFIKIPVSCKSSITILEGDYRTFNDFIYKPEVTEDGNDTLWKYKQNTCKINFQVEDFIEGNSQHILPPLNERSFTPISKLQLLHLNTGESHPFADRLVEYLTGNATTAIDEISDNIKRAQNVMSKNGFAFDIKGLWEPKMQLIAYDYIMNSGPIYAEPIQEIGQNGDLITNYKLVDLHRGAHLQLGHKSNSSVFDVLGYIDKDAEKWYASWQLETIELESKQTKGTCIAKDTIQDTDIYNGLYDLD